MHLFFLRHGEAEDRETWTGSERDRPLTPEGSAEMEQVAAGLAALDLGVEVVITSGFARADATAEIVGQVLGVEVVSSDELAPGASLADVVRILQAHEQASRILLVGHEPDLSHVIGELIASPHPASLVLKKAGCARVDVPRRMVKRAAAANDLSGEGTLMWLLTPRELVLIGGHKPAEQATRDAAERGQEHNERDVDSEVSRLP